MKFVIFEMVRAKRIGVKGVRVEIVLRVVVFFGDESNDDGAELGLGEKDQYQQLTYTM